jgi:peroxiredoxin
MKYSVSRLQSALFIQILVWLSVVAITACAPESSKRLKIGDRAPDFAIVDLTGASISLAQWRGNPVILRFWDTECKYCRADTPSINYYFDQYQERGLKVLYVATGNETEARVREFIEVLDVAFPVAIDSDMKVAESYQVTIVPQTIFISPDQKIITAVVGGVGKAELAEILGPYLSS